jgi:hypothetical protein
MHTTDEEREALDRRQFLLRATGAAFAGFLLPHELLNASPAPGRHARPFEILVLGDSIMWGQGLKDEQKFSYYVERWVRNRLPGLEVHRHVFAHSGAQIHPNPVKDAEPATHGEVPNRYPSITAQLATAQSATVPLHAPLDPQAVSLILLDGGINDFGTKKILSPDPTVGRSWVREHTRKLCVDRMKILLPQVGAAFPNAKIVVTNYFQIVSEKSDMAYIWELLRFWDVVGGAVNAMSAPLRTKMADQSLAFHEESTVGLREAVAESNRQLVATARTSGAVRAVSQIDLASRAPGRVAFAEIPFGPHNAYGASQTFLFHLNEPDPAAAVRKPMCQAQVPNASPEFPNCLLAAAGHPNVQGARVYADAIIGVAGRWLPEWQATFGVTPSAKTERTPVMLQRP